MDIQKIYKLAKEAILEHGEHLPTLYVEFQGISELVIAPIIGFGSESGTTLDKQKLLFSIGRRLGQEYLGVKVSTVAFVCEAWTSSIPKGESYKYDRPSDDPNRKEVLIVSTLDASAPPNLKQSASLAEMLRDGKGNLVDLLADSKPLEVNFNKMLISFLAGTISADMSDSELTELMMKLS